MAYYFYLARCADSSLYSGYCSDLGEREKTHNAGKGSKYTRSRLPLQFVYHEEFATKSEAMKREAEIKRWSKMQKEELVTQRIKTAI